MYGLDARAYDDHSDFVDYSRRLFHHVPIARSIIWSIFPILNKILPNQSVSTEFSDWFIALYKTAVELREKNNIKRDDYLNLLLDLQIKKNLTVPSAAANAFTFFLDGFETTSYMLGNAINELAKNKECQQKLRSEVKSYKSIGFEDLNQMSYLDAVVNGKIH